MAFRKKIIGQLLTKSTRQSYNQFIEKICGSYVAPTNYNLPLMGDRHSKASFQDIEAIAFLCMFIFVILRYFMLSS